MGRYYALNDGEASRIADAIADHYKPLGPDDSCPTAPESVIVALADKVDALAAFFSAAEKPTGSRDPYALRRAGLGIIRLILENGLRFRIFNSFVWSAKFFSDDKKAISLAEELFNFIIDRLNIYLRGRGFEYDVIAAALYAGDVSTGTMKRMEQDFTQLVRRAEALRRFLSSDDGANLLAAYQRASNIVREEERRDNHSYDEPVDAELLDLPEEVALYQRLAGMTVTLTAFLEAERFDRAMGRLATLRHPVDEFFEKVTVNTDKRVMVAGVEKSLRENRLRLLARIRATMNQVADFSQIEG